MKTLPKTFITLGVIMLAAVQAPAQLTEHFSDGDLTGNPPWVGNTSDFIVNASGQLQSNNTVANSSFSIATASTKATVAHWEFYTQLAFSTSASNYIDVYLVASGPELLQTAIYGYFVRVGNTTDEICLYRKDENGGTVKIIDGVDGIIAGSNNSIKIKVTRDANDQWTLYRDITGMGNNYFAEGKATDATYQSSACFGIVVHQSSSLFFQKHFFDDIIITDFIPDATAPAIISATTLNEYSLQVMFNETVDANTAGNINNYLAGDLLHPSSALVDPANASMVTLVFNMAFVSGKTYRLQADGIADISGNRLTQVTVDFMFYKLGMYSIVIDEIMADPTPEVGLPGAEWIELKNTSPVAINLQGFRIGKQGTTSGPMPAYLLKPDSFVIITASSNVTAMKLFGDAIAVTGFPSLSNEGDYLFLRSNTGAVMHHVNYSSNWYQNVAKAAGGWSLEMIDTKNPCSGVSNWKACTDASGGTPGRKNSMDALNKDAVSPNLLRAFANDSSSLTLYFDEPLDAISATDQNNYSVSDGIGTPVSVAIDSMGFAKTKLVLQNVLQPGRTYTLTVNGVTDCSGNKIGSNNARVGLASAPDSFDIVINEILFDPAPASVDYLELFNRSNKIIDLSKLSVANRSSSNGNIGTPEVVAGDHYLFFPGDFIALSSEPATIAREYLVKFPERIQMVSLPSFPDTKGNAILLNKQGTIIDELGYDAKWHFALLDNAEAVSLERIDYNRPTNEPSNWTSAASTAGFGTPGYINSQFRADLTPGGQITINPKLFSPDNDGFDDLAFIEFMFPEPGYVANVTIYDAAGRSVRLLQRNTTCAAKGSFRWDGLDDKMNRVTAGSYIVFTDIFNLKGQKRVFKNTVFVAKKF